MKENIKEGKMLNQAWYLFHNENDCMVSRKPKQYSPYENYPSVYSVACPSNAL